LLPGADADLVRPLQRRLEDSFEAIRLKTKVEKLVAAKTGIMAHLSQGGSTEKKKFDKVLVSIGRRPNVEGVGLENTRIVINDSGFIQADLQQRTAEPNIFAIGDVAGEPMLAHKASREGKVAAEVIAGLKAEFDNIAIPAVVFTDPELAWCGLTETQAKAEGRKIKAIRYPWAASGRAMTLGRTEGQTKLIIDPETERVLGVGIVGPGAGELIAEGVLAIELGSQTEDLELTIHPHPTLTETISEVASVSLGSSIHYYAKKR
ncbi:MAG: FAD-dependent oxidoreductase, partial [Proteobacteria bacterium]|nr:FAD-dependent oxidoreductase [Pseudomonadota bacterium]